jgi:NDP-sugar pyrophosphorylase family protein
MARRLTHVTAAILAGGLGTRLQAVVGDRPKVLAPVGGRPYLTYLLDQLVSARAREVVLLTGHRAEQIRAELGESYKGVRLRYSVEEAPLGTAGALRHALPLLRKRVMLLMNGDSYCDVDFGGFWRFHQWQGADASLVLARVPDTGRFGRVRVTRDGLITSFEEKRETPGRGWINAGVYLLSRDLIASLPAEQPLSLEQDLLPGWVTKKSVYGYRRGLRFLDIGTPESYAEAEAFFQQGRESKQSVSVSDIG